jgi:hypothetical protein
MQLVLTGISYLGVNFSGYDTLPAPTLSASNFVGEFPLDFSKYAGMRAQAPRAAGLPALGSRRRIPYAQIHPHTVWLSR